MNKGGFSWRRFFGVSAALARISRAIGIPLTRSGRQRKLGAFTERILITFGLIVLSFIIAIFYKIKKLLAMLIDV